MSTEENTIAAVPDLTHLNPYEVEAYDYLKNLPGEATLASYFEDGQLNKPKDRKVDYAINLLLPNLNFHNFNKEFSNYSIQDFLQLVEARNFGAHNQNHSQLSTSAYDELVRYQESLPVNSSVSSLDDEGEISPIIETDEAVAALKKTEANRNLLNGLYVEREANTFYRLDSDKPALIDQGMKLRVINKDLETFKAAIELAESKGWVGIQVNGSATFKAEAWYQASIKGLTVRGYEPNEEDKKRLLEYQLEQKPELTADEKAVVQASYIDAQDYALERNSGVVYPNQANENRAFSGRVVKVFDSHVVQDIGRNTMAIHEKSRVGDIEPGTKLNIQYNGRSASVKEVQQKTSSLEL